MKYTIETTDDGCIETLEFSYGMKFKKATKRRAFGYEATDEDFADQLKEAGFCREIVEKSYEAFDGFGSINFLELAELER